MRTANPARIARALCPAPRAGVALLLVSLLCGCASQPAQPTQAAGLPKQDLDWVLGGADRLGPGDALPTETLETLLQVTPEMHRFAQDVAGNEPNIAKRVHRLVRAISGRNGLSLKYDAQATLTAAEAFGQRRVNCLSYTLLFIALARDINIRAQFNDVEIPPVWDIGGDQTVMLYKHLNIKVDFDLMFSEVIDVSGDEYDPSYPQHVIPDSAALALYFNNRSADLRMQHHYFDALRYQLRAVQAAPQIDYLWANLADLYSLTGSARAARIAINEALTLDPTSMMDTSVAAAIYQREGDQRTAALFQERAQQFLDASPYYHYQLALNALGGNNNDAANEEVHKAILLLPREHRFYFLAAVIEERRGNLQIANDYMHHALELTSDWRQQQRYQSKFALLKQRQG